MVKQGVSRLVTIRNRDCFQQAKECLNHLNELRGLPAIKSDSKAIEEMVDFVLFNARQSGQEARTAMEIDWLLRDHGAVSQKIEFLNRRHHEALRRINEAGWQGDSEAVKRIQAQLPKLQEAINVSTRKLQDIQYELSKAKKSAEIEGCKAEETNISRLHDEEENLRKRALEFVASHSRLQLHISVIHNAMDLADLFRQFPTDDEDVKLIQVLGMRTFNAFGASLKLALSGYWQNSALTMRDILETVFLLDLFKGDRTKIERWRLANERERKKEFSPFKVRKALDDQDGLQDKKREERYKRFSILAAHPTMSSVDMMRPQRDGNAVSGPFFAPRFLDAVLTELGCLAVEVGDVLDRSFPETWVDVLQVRAAYARSRKHWLDHNLMVLSDRGRPGDVVE